MPDVTDKFQKTGQTIPQRSVLTKRILTKSYIDNPDTVKIGAQDRNIEIIMKDAHSNTWFKDIFPIFTLILGVGIKELMDNFSSRRLTKKIGKRWKAELEILVEPLERQIMEIKKSVEYHNANHNDPPKLVRIIALEGQNFESLDKTELLTYINRYYVKDYKSAVSLAGRVNLQISVMKSNSKSLNERFISFLDDAGKRHDKLNSNFQELMQSLDKYKNIITNAEGEGALLGDKFRKIDELYGKQVLPHIGDGKFDYLKLEIDYFTPMIKELNRLSVDIRTIDMASYTRKCLDNIAGIKMETVYFTINMNNHIGYFEEDRKRLNNILQDLDKANRRFYII